MQDTAVAKVGDAQIAEIYEITDLKELLRKIKQIDALKEALASCDRFRENSIKYAMLEAAALIRVVRLGGQSKLFGFRRKTAEWLASLSEHEAQEQIQKCSDGLTIDQVWKRDIHTKDIYAELTQEKDFAIENLQESGYTLTQGFAEKARAGLPPDAASAMIDGLRHALRRAGAVGIGDEGEYIMPSHPGNKDRVAKAIALRYQSINRDLMRIKQIVSQTGIKLTECDIDEACGYRDRPDLKYVLKAIETYGTFENPLDFD